ncbi:hypothetical protein GCM10011613_27040 [Cellvibrio zantedeschiae]|uniref:Type II secretion system protein H n=1 Tax=Cellvibrio zantedeschiae TaxID=1237077 RepID=A0ABQ3B9S7_9GAMM|nr:GspH/FimT family pseudopilin [Cellvibrio zantedeschiae]GGY80579.1 hypothetical protein GCM10011613_27040 [Cellvibrio zantedeschiae]
MRSFGFTLIELVITLSIVSILLGFGLPNLFGHIQNSRVKVATQNLFESLELTRSQAVFSNKRITIRKQVQWEEGWEVFIDANNDGLPNNNEQTVKKYEKLKGIRIIANRPVSNYVSFVGSGEGRYANGTSNAGAFQAGAFTVCPQTKGKGYELILARGGRVRTHEISAQDCAAI